MTERPFSCFQVTQNYTADHLLLFVAVQNAAGNGNYPAAILFIILREKNWSCPANPHYLHLCSWNPSFLCTIVNRTSHCAFTVHLTLLLIFLYVFLLDNQLQQVFWEFFLCPTLTGCACAHDIASFLDACAHSLKLCKESASWAKYIVMVDCYTFYTLL